MNKTILVTNIPNPYRVPLFNTMHTLFNENDIHLKIVFGADNYKRRLFKLDKNELKFDYHILQDNAYTLSKDGENAYFFFKGLLRFLFIEKPNCIIVSGFSTATIKSLLYCKFTNTPFIIWTGSIGDESKKPGLIRMMQRKFLANSAAAFIAYGTKTKQYLDKLTTGKKKVFVAMNTVDTEFFRLETEKARQTILPSTKNHFLYLGYLVPRKNVESILIVAKELLTKRKDFIFDIIGDGISRTELETYVSENKLEECVKFHGFKQKNELPTYFAQSKALLFQTDFDIWGLVLNEAMASGLPCISSINAGASIDLIIENETGYIADYKDTKKILTIIEEIIENPVKYVEMGKRSSEFIRKNVSLKLAAEGFLAAVKSTYKH